MPALSAQAENLPYWLALSRAPGVGPVHFQRLLDRFGSPRAVLAASRAELAELGLKTPLIEYLQHPDWESVERDLRWAEQPGHFLLSLWDPAYPPRLRQIHDPPPLLFVAGDPAILSLPQLAMIGSRNPSRGGEQTAFEFARHLAGVGLVITSGLAFGIDTASHRGALADGGQTVAVMGTGPDLIYPARHRELAAQIALQGALVSEFFPGTPARALNFPRRNRIISGLSLGTLVVEATLRSGSLITARQAAEQGREVFAIPGSIHNPLAKGCHALLKEGAKLVEEADDIIFELARELAGFVGASATPATSQAVAGEQELDADYALLFEHMALDEPVSVDTLVERCGLTPEAVSSMLLILELRGLVASLSGGQYTRLGQRNL
jgi:DNA processing protein